MDELKKNTFLETARKRFAVAEQAERKIREEFKTDLRYVAGDQWEEADLRAREQSKRPALTFNRLPTFVQQVSNEARQSKPSVRFSPVDSGADKDTAEVFEGIARHIQYKSKADVAYETALEHATAGSFGYFRLLTDYASDTSDKQEIKFEPVLDPLSIYGVLIPACKREPCRWAFVVRDLSEDEYKTEYPDSEIASLPWDEARNLCEWVGEKTVRVAEYWYTEVKRRTLLTLANGQRVFSDELEAQPATEEIASKREVVTRTVKSCVTNGYEVLEGTDTEWAGKRVPIFAVLGRVLVIEGEPRVFSLVRFMRDPQRLINLYKSGIAENIGLANRVPYIGFKGQFEGVEQQWATANVTNRAYLEVNPVTIDGRPAPFPQRQQFEPAIQALSIAAAQETDDLKSIPGIFDSSLGAEDNAKSGIALQRKQIQSGITNLHFIDNLKRAQEEAGVELGYLIPRIIDTEQEIRIMGEDDQERVVTVNAPSVDPETGKPTNYMLEAGRYDVTVSSGPTYASKRVEAFDLLTQLAQAYPQLMQIGGDIIFRNSDIPGGEEVAERFKKTLPPGLAEDEKQQQIPPQVQAQMQQMGAMIEQLTQQLNAANGGLELKRMELDSRERIAALQAQVEVLKTEAGLSSKENISLLQAELAQIRANIQALAAPEQEEPQAPQAEAA